MIAAPRPLFRHLLLRCSTFLRPCRSPDAVYLLHPWSRAHLGNSVAAPGATLTPTSDRHAWRKCKRIVGNNPCHVVVLLHCSNFRHLTARDGGNAKGLLGTIRALSVACTSRESLTVRIRIARRANSTVSPAIRSCWLCKNRILNCNRRATVELSKKVAAADACAKAVTWGFGKIYYFRDGFAGWKGAGYRVQVPSG